MSEARFRLPVRVAYVDTDQGGIMHHGAYVRYLEVARVEYLREHGVTYKDLEYDHHFALPVIDMRVKYKRPARFDDELVVETWVGKLGAASIRFDYRVTRGDELMTEAEVTLACVKLPSGRPVRLPDVVRRACE